ncbi:MAG: recombination protein NinB [Pseudomonadota bacterium]
MPRQSYKLRVRTERQRAEALKVLNEAEINEQGFQVHFKRWTRTDDQNALLWVLLGRFARDAEINGQRYSADAWKCILMNALGHDMTMLPTLDGERFFAEGHRSSRLTIGEMTQLIEFIYSEAAERGIDLEDRRAA